MKKEQAKNYVNKIRKVSREHLMNEEFKKNLCDHKINRDIQIQDLGHGKVKCVICKREFSTNEIAPDELKKAIAIVSTAYESIKLTGESNTSYSLPDTTLEEIGTLLTQLHLLPEFYMSQYIAKLKGNNFKSAKNFNNNHNRNYDRNNFQSTIQFSNEATNMDSYVSSLMSEGSKGDKKKKKNKKNSW